MIRQATLDDVPRLVELGVEFITQTVFHQFVQPNEAAMTATVTALIEGANSTVFVLEGRGRVLGMIGVGWYDDPFSGERTVSEPFWWVTPVARGHGARLLRVAIAWARRAGATQMQMGQPYGDDTAAGIYEALGFAPVQLLWQRRLT